MYDTVLSPRTAPTMAAGPIAIMPQQIEPFIAEALDAIPPDRLPDMRLSGSAEAIGTALADAFASLPLEPDWLATWLLSNISFQMRLYRQLTRSPSLLLRLESVSDDGCPRFHTDAVRYRLLCTYRGPGTEWIDPKAVSKQADGQPLDPTSIRRLERGAVAFIRGAKGATPERPALVHRSPKIAGTGAVRLLLAIDADED